YNPTAAAPLGMTALGYNFLVRMETLKWVDVYAYPTCGPAATRLRRHLFAYADDADTKLPRLHAVDVTGEVGTDEANVAIPLARYGYGRATTRNDAKNRDELVYDWRQRLETPSLPEATIAQTVPADPVHLSLGAGYATTYALMDVTGDG